MLIYLSGLLSGVAATLSLAAVLFGKERSQKQKEDQNKSFDFDIEAELEAIMNYTGDENEVEK